MVKQRNSMIESEIMLEKSLATFSETDKLAAQRSRLAVWPQEARERLKPAAGYRKRKRQRSSSAGARAGAPGASARKGPRAQNEKGGRRPRATPGLRPPAQKKKRRP